MRVAIVASGELAQGDLDHLDAADLVIAADGGALTLHRVGRRPDRVIGDLDSLTPAFVAALEADGVQVDRHSPDKDASDTELAVEAAIAAGGEAVVLLGATGGPRLDHELANVLLLADPAFAGRDLRLIADGTTIRGLSAGDSLQLGGEVGGLVTLLPVGGDAVGVSTDGLRWALDAATLRFGRSRGLSNEVVNAPASVSLERGTLLVVEHAAEGAQQQ